MKKQRTHYSDAYRAEALALAERVGIAAAAREMGLQPSQLYQWRTKLQQKKTFSEREQVLAEMNARLKRQLALSPPLGFRPAMGLDDNINTVLEWLVNAGKQRYARGPRQAVEDIPATSGGRSDAHRPFRLLSLVGVGACFTDYRDLTTDIVLLAGVLIIASCTWPTPSMRASGSWPGNSSMKKPTLHPRVGSSCLAPPWGSHGVEQFLPVASDRLDRYLMGLCVCTRHGL